MNIKNVKEIDKMLDQLSNRGMEFIATSMESKPFIEALKSQEYHQALDELLHKTETEKTRIAEIIKYVLKKGVEPQMKEYLGLVDKEQYIYYACLLAGSCADILIMDWKKLEKMNAYNQLCSIPCQVEVIEELFKCTEKYFIRINEIEEYTDMRCQIHEIKRYAERMISLYEEII